MRLDNTTTNNSTRLRRGLMLLAGTGVALGATLLGAVPAHANDTTKQVTEDGHVVFATSDSSRGVSGSVTFTVGQDGNWTITGTGHNSHLIGRNVHWICDLTWDASSVGHTTGTDWVPGKTTHHTITGAAYDPYIQADFAAIADHGRADCDIVVG
jgi:hypothetical protein